MNSLITDTEIKKSIKNLNNNKVPGLDGVINEYIKYSQDKLLPVYKLLFNNILCTGLFPTTWSLGTIIPIYKCKGEKSDPNNYCPITLISCVSKLLTSILHERTNLFIESNKILSENQAGFRSGYSINDHVITLSSLIDLHKFHKKKLYCCFVDFSKTFDSVWRVGFWQKLLNSGINGKHVY